MNRDSESIRALIRADTEGIRGITWTMENLLRASRTDTLVEFVPEFVARLRKVADDIDALIDESEPIS